MKRATDISRPDPSTLLNKYKLDEYLLFEPEEKKNTLS